MAKKKFFNKKVASRKNNLINGCIIIVCIIGIAACFILTRNFSSDESENVEVVAKLHQSVNIEVNSSNINKEIFFLQLSGVSDDEITINFDEVLFDTLGEYSAVVNVLDKTETVTVNIVDVTRPVLNLGSHTIEPGEKYSLNDFVVDCTDNSGYDCSIRFKDDAIDSNNNLIDYTSYTKSGTYDIVIVASDPSGNENYVTTKLTINGDNVDSNNDDDSVEDDANSTTCTYGKNNYSDEYILTYDVSNNGCALSLDLYQNESIRESIEIIANKEVLKIQTEVDAIAGLTPDLMITKNVIAILNTSGNGFVGYSLLLQVKNSDGEIIAEYYLNLDGSRTYVENPYKLK